VRAIVLVCLCACGPSQLARTATMIGCAPNETEIVRPDEHEWEARCHGTSSFHGPGSPDNVDRLFACTNDKCVEVYPR